eukprot:1856351-Alexandrium_andersonii.AAC.1
MWPAQRRVVVAVEDGEGSDSDSGEFQPDWAGEESEGSGDEQVFPAGASRVVKMEIDEEDASGRVAAGNSGASAPSAGPLAPP